MVRGLKGSARETVCEFVLLILNKVDRQNKGCFILSYKFLSNNYKMYNKVMRTDTVLISFFIIINWILQGLIQLLKSYDKNHFIKKCFKPCSFEIYINQN